MMHYNNDKFLLFILQTLLQSNKKSGGFCYLIISIIDAKRKIILNVFNNLHCFIFFICLFLDNFILDIIKAIEIF